MISWATQRKFSYGVVFFLIVGICLSVVWYIFFYKTPSCTDGIQNGTETGVDCGGSCQTVCTTDALTPVVLWTKALNVSGNVYTASAYIENPNVRSRNPKVQYEFKLYDAKNTLITSRRGETFIPKNKKFIVVEPNFVIPDTVPKRVEFEFLSFDTWVKDTSPEPEISIDYSELLATSTSPRIEGKIINKSLSNIAHTELAVMVLDGKENVVATSRTFVDRLVSNTSQSFVFTWPKPFDLGVESCATPVDVVLLIDKSTSMRSEKMTPPEPFTTVKNVAENFIKKLRDNDFMSVVSFGTVASQESELSSNSNLSISAIRGLQLSSSTEQTNISDGLHIAQEELLRDSSRTDAKKIAVLLTDGIPTEPKQNGTPLYPQLSAQSISQVMRSQGIEIYAIGLGNTVNNNFLKSIASDDAHYFFAPTKETLDRIYDGISSALCVRKPNTIRVIYRIVPEN